VPAAAVAVLKPPPPAVDATRVSLEAGVEPYLRALVELLGSDLHCKVGSPPRIRIDGTLRTMQAPVLTPADTERMLTEVLRPDLLEHFGRANEVDFACSMPGVGRFRVNAFRSRGSVGIVFRRVSLGAIPLEDLGLPPAVGQLALEPRGLVLVTGPTGSGKTTTLAGMIDRINARREVHVVTIEDPIEVIHEDKLAMINQREVGLDTADFGSALRAAMRQDPDVILVGEMRDEETVRAALSAAETGHFVLSTLHTTDAQETVNRIVDFFPPHEQMQVRVSLAGALRGIVAQRLVPRADGLGRCSVVEVCVATGRIAEAILDPEKTNQITELVSQGGYYGMQTFDQHLVALVRDGVVTVDAAAAVASKPHDLAVELRRLGLVA
jgi:twitching motility protein PilT